MFKITHQDGNARVGELHVNGKVIPTPFYMPVATKGSVKYMDPVKLKEAGIKCFISNSLVLSWRPGLDMLRKTGGIHKFANWDGGVFTDSGGFQSLDPNFLLGTTHEYALFQNPMDGQKYKISPRRAMEIQHAIGSDVAMCIDEVPQHNDSYQKVRSKTLRTHMWARECLKAHHEIDTEERQLLFGIAQGGNHFDIRKKSIEFISKLGFDGIAQGGLAIGEPIEKMYATLSKTCKLMPNDKCRYLMGVGNPIDILESVYYGIDCFDSTFPTQNARHGTLFTMKGKVRITQKQYEFDFSPIEEGCDCYACKNYTKAYVRHMLKQGEAVGLELATYHNIRFMQRMIEGIHLAIKEGRYEKYKNELQKVLRL